MVDDWDNPKTTRNIGTRAIYDFTKSNTSADIAPVIRTYEDQTMDQNEIDQLGAELQARAELGMRIPNARHPSELMSHAKKPWILERAKNWVSGLRNADKVGVNPKDQLGAAKVPMHLVPPASTILQALCMDDGNIKYGPYNVRMEPIQAIGYISAAKRHLDAYLDGQDYDPVTGKPHLGYALATIGLVIDAWLGGTLIDNRPVPGIGGQLLDALAMKPGEEPRSPADYKRIFDEIEAFGKQQTQERLNANQGS